LRPPDSTRFYSRHVAIDDRSFVIARMTHDALQSQQHHQFNIAANGAMIRVIKATKSKDNHPAECWRGVATGGADIPRFLPKNTLHAGAPLARANHPKKTCEIYHTAPLLSN
jgi:hypothetical protein